MSADRDAAATRFSEAFAATGDAARAYAADPAGAALLRLIGAHSPYLAESALRETAVLLRCAERGHDDAFALALAPLGRADPAAARDVVGAMLRRVKRQAALIAAAADLTGAWPLDRVTGALSHLAEAAIDHAVAHLLLAAATRGEIKARRGQDPVAIGRGGGLTVLGMGKLGARELNYSSDVDLMLLFDPYAASLHPDTAQRAYVRLGRDLVRLLEERTGEGYVFRTDLRLRPDPAATPLAVNIAAAAGYYESLGQNWERAAMIKARPVAGDRALGETFLRDIRPFVWRRHLDYAALADIHSIKRQIHAHRGGERIAVAGHDVKLGRGGIREIEFSAQVLQLIWGGRDPALRDPTTLGALAALAAAGRLDRRAAVDLADAYGFLRTLEHRLQMIEDRQTHRLPTDADGLARIASFCGYADTGLFADALLGHLSRVERHYAALFEAAPALTVADAAATGQGSLVFTGVEDDPETLTTLAAMGFAEPPRIAALLRGWHHGHPRATRSQRARELLTELTPALLAAFARQPDPDQALARFDTVLARLAAGVQVLSLLGRHPILLERVAGLLGAAAPLADHLATHPASLDALLAGSLAQAGGEAAAALPALVKDARHFEEAIAGARRLVTEGRFAIDAAMLEGTLDADRAGELRSDLAEAAIGALLPWVLAEFAERHGRIEGGQLAVMALGKLGGREMLPGSDLDLVLVYDHAEDAGPSEGGARSLAPSEYFVKLVPRLLAALTAPGTEGPLFSVDMRLRPSGNKGPVAVSLAAFRQYHTENAWTWERMALTRGRVVAGPPALRRAVAEAQRAGLLRPGAAELALADAAAMRARLAAQLPPEGPWDLKLMPGGLIEVEFIAQALQLAHGAEHPAVLTPTTRVALARLGEAGLLPEAAALIRAERFFRAALGALRLTVGRTVAAGLPAPAVAALLGAVGEVGELHAFRRLLEEIAAGVRAAFERRIGKIG